ncbi:hypothetical protein D9M70_482800 [compost metagenome]
MMRRIKRWVVQCATHLVGNAEQATGIDSFKVATQSALTQLDVETASLWALLQLWRRARCLERYAHHSRKLLELQEVAHDR